MSKGDVARLLASYEPPPTAMERADGGSPMLLIADHAGNLIPHALRQLGLSPPELERHIAVDIGILGVCCELSRRLDATLIHQRYSRLVIDCNRHPQHESAFVATTDGTDVPGNNNLSVADAAGRIIEIFMPYHVAIGSWLDRRRDQGTPTALIAMHSFTPHHGVLRGERPWPISVLFNRDDAIARRLIDLLRTGAGLNVGVNEPYVVDDESDFSIAVHGESRGVPSVEIEIRQDMISAVEDQVKWGAMLAPLLSRAVQDVLGLPNGNAKLDQS